MTTDFTKPEPGTRFQLNRVVAGTPTFLAVATTLSFTQTNELEDATGVDRNAPNAIPSKQSRKKRKSWRITFSGKIDLKDRDDLQADFDAEDPVTVELKFDRTLAQGGGKYVGDVDYESLEFGKQEQGLVSFTAQASGNGPIVWSPAAA
jgi:hypothetical protein